MDENMFWEIVAKSRENVSTTNAEGNFAVQSSELRKQLAEISDPDRRKFCKILEVLYDKSYTWDLWGAAYIINGGCSDDGFSDFRGWLISMGCRIFEAAIENVESLGDLCSDKSIECFFYSEFLSISKCNFDIDWKKEPSGIQFDVEELKLRFPKLCATFGGKA